MESSTNKEKCTNLSGAKLEVEYVDQVFVKSLAESPQPSSVGQPSPSQSIQDVKDLYIKHTQD